jgi:hypothetical protein
MDVERGGVDDLRREVRRRKRLQILIGGDASHPG